MLLLALSIEVLAAISDLPPLKPIIQGMRALWQDGILPHDIQVSGARWLIGWSIGITIGTCLGILTGRSRPIRYSLEGFLALCRAIPFISLLPLAIRLFGLSETKALFLVAWACALTCWVITHQTAQLLPAQLKWRAVSLGLPRRTWILRILVPSCADGIQVALRTSLALGLIVVAIAEMSGVYERSSGLWWSEGIGYRLFQSLDAGKDDLLLASILTFTGMGIAADQLFVIAWAGTRGVAYRIRRRAVRRLVARAPHTLDIGVRAWLPPEAVELTVSEARYNGKHVIDGLSLSVGAGETLVVIGESGCGKTTLIRSIANLADESFHVERRLKIGDEEVTVAGSWAGIVLQEAPVFGHLTVWDNIAIVGRIRGESREYQTRAVWDLLTEFGLTSAAEQRANTLSGGQRQRLSLAATLASGPRLLLLDEPFGALDALTRRRLQDFYIRHIAGRITAVFVTHDLHEALRVGNVIRIGVDRQSPVVHVDNRGVSPKEWEQDSAFLRLQNRLVELLEADSADPQRPSAA